MKQQFHQQKFMRSVEVAFDIVEAPVEAPSAPL